MLDSLVPPLVRTILLRSGLAASGICLALFCILTTVGQPDGSGILRFPLGERVDVSGPERMYEFDLEAGTAVDIKIGPVGVLSFEAYIFGPDSLELSRSKPTDLPISHDGIYAVRVLQPFRVSELISIGTSTGGKFRLRLIPAGPADYSVFVSSPRPFAEPDQKLMQAAKLMYRLMPVHRDRLDRAESVEIARRRVDLFRDAGDRVGRGLALKLLGSRQEATGDRRSAIASTLEARAVLLEADRRSEAIGLDPCPLYEEMGEIQKWIHCAHDNVSLSRRVGDRQAEGRYLRLLGLAYHMLADDVRAREYFLESLDLWNAIQTEANPYSFERVQLFKDLGNMKQGIIRLVAPIEYYPPRTEADLREAITFYQEGLDLDARQPRPTGFKNYFVWQIGALSRDLGDHSTAIDLLQRSLANYSRVEITKALIQLDIAKLHILRGEKQNARELLLQALPIIRRSNASLERLADLFIELGDPATAIEINSVELSSAEKRGSVTAMARYYGALARAERALGNFSNARDRILSAIQISESLRDRIMDDEMRSTYFAATKRFYDFCIDLLMQMHKAQPERRLDLVALEASERSRSRTLLDMLNRAGVDVRRGVDAKYLDAERAVRERIAAVHMKQLRTSETATPPGRAEELRRELAALAREQQVLETEIRGRSPHYASITPASSLSIPDIQKLIEPGTVLIEYSLGYDKSYLWVITPDKVTSAELPPRRDLERMVAAMYEAVANRRAASGARQQDDREFRAASGVLGEKLFGAVGDEIRGKRLVIVPDGTLHYVPWATIPYPGPARSELVQGHEIVVLPSASVLAVLRKEAAKRSPATQLVNVFADPVFSSRDPRLASSRRKSPKADAPANNVRRDLDLVLNGLDTGNKGVLPRLSFSQREAATIRSLSGRLSSINLDFNASRAAVLEQPLDDHRIIHFATHGLVDDRNPALSGLVLSLVDQKGNDIDGFLRLQDIYNLKLNADLVVLSACNTALGKEVRGEGIVGLTRGFMYAGSPRVVATLWKVDDVATAHFMSIFYKKMLAEYMRPAAALRAAQNEMMKQPRWRSPYYWAPFVLQGEWK